LESDCDTDLSTTAGCYQSESRLSAGIFRVSAIPRCLASLLPLSPTRADLCQNGAIGGDGFP